MDKCSSGEDVLIKIRKPYTITKQRERWTDDEHNRFLEALKLHGRAWQRIEEHIGTKNAVQIRSHAQKFFSKLEKDALVKGVPISKALDIDIPPPRPKRKPSNPYPRKTGACASTLQATSTEDKLLTSVSSSCPGNPILDLEKVPITQKPAQVEETVYSKENQDDGYDSDVFTNFQEAPSTSVSSANKHTKPISAPFRKSCSFREFVPLSKEVSYQDDPNASHITIKPNGNPKSDELNDGSLLTDDMLAAQNYLRHVPVQTLEGSLGICTETSFPEISCQESAFHHPIQGLPSLVNSHEANARKSSTHQSFPTISPPFNLPSSDNQEDFQSCIQFSSVFSSLIMSNLLQNPAVHAAASFAASFQSRHLGQAPSMAAIAAATVTAATAWWAVNGLLPMCPLHRTFPCAPVSATAAPSMDVDQSPLLNDQSLQAEDNRALKAKNPASELPAASSSDSEESGRVKLDIESKPDDQDKLVAVTETDDSNKTKNRKQVDRSSCGSNTTSSGDDIETDALEKHEKVMEEPIEPDTCHPTIDSMNRRLKSPYNFTESWKEVSEEGRLAFKALFTRQVLPQSFSAPLDLKNKDHNQNIDGNVENPLLLDLNTNTWGSWLTTGIEKNEISTAENKEEGFLTIGLGSGKLKARRTGFKPYKRCSVEAKESKVVNATSFQGEERGPKRIRLEEEALS